jgi:hypothetical protein
VTSEANVLASRPVLLRGGGGLMGHTHGFQLLQWKRVQPALSFGKDHGISRKVLLEGSHGNVPTAVSMGSCLSVIRLVG